MLKNLFVTISFIVCSLGYFQANATDSGSNDLRKFDYSKVDSFVVNLPEKKYESLNELTETLTVPFQTDEEKFRAIFKWITENISYDCDAFHYTEKFNKNIKYYNILRKTISDSYVENIYSKNVKITPEDVFERRTAICSGYANLLERMCEIVSIPCEKVRGYVKSSSAEISTSMNVIAHAWNVVNLNGQWYPIDITWASGYTDGNCDKYVKDYSDTYFIQSPEQFIKNHYPRKKEWQLVDKPITIEEFCQSPTVLEGYFKNDLRSPSSNGLLKAEYNEPVKITFSSAKELESENVGLYLDSKSCKEGTYCLKKENDNFYSVEFKAMKKGESVATIVVNSSAAIQYKVIVK